MKKILLIIIGAFVAFSALLHLTDTDDQVFYWMNTCLHAEKNPSRVIWLQNYRLKGQPRKLSCINQNLSGITYNKKTGTLFLITNAPTQIHEISTNGDCLRKIELIDFYDTEGIVHLYDNYFAVLEERRRTLNIIHINTETTQIAVDRIVQSLSLSLEDNDNKGFEGIAYNPDNRLFYIVKEEPPLQLLKVEGLINKTRIKISSQPRLIRFDLYMDDFSGLHFDSKTRHLLFLSDESKMVAEVSLQGEQVSFMELEKGFSGLHADIPQAEGIAMDGKRNIYIVSEPNLIYTFSKKNPKGFDGVFPHSEPYEQ